MFRNTRALSGAYTTIVNFTTAAFFRRAKKLSILNEIKSRESTTTRTLKFPMHYKHRNDNELLAAQNIDNVTHLNVEATVVEAYELALDLTKSLGLHLLLIKENVYELDDLSEFIYDHLKTKSKLNDNSQIDSDNEDSNSDSEFGLDNDDDEEDDHAIQKQSENDDIDSFNSDTDDNEDEKLKTVKSSLEGLRIHDTVPINQEQSYFKITLNGRTQYLHKQAACYLLTDDNATLSSDRLKRVIQGSKK